MPTTSTNALPAYKRIKASILKRIESGQLNPFDTVESERLLASLHSVSPMTARHALAELERDGIVERRPGAGTFVAPPKIHVNRLMSFTEEMAGRNLSAASRVLSLKVVGKEPEIAGRLRLEAGSRLIRVERLRLGGGEPFAIETCYLAAAEFGELTRAKLDRGSLYAILKREYGVELAYADEEVDAIRVSPEIASLLSIRRSQPLLRIRQLVYSTKGNPIIYGICLNRADRHIVRLRRVR
ncbi:MAG: GntR family transcriptional regulator [Acidobacteriaceae bacterium]